MAKSAADILAKVGDPAHTRIVTVSLLHRLDLLDAYKQAEAEWSAAKRYDTGIAGGSAVLAQRVADLHAEMAAEMDDYRFQNIGRRAWADLLAKHPPSKEQRARNDGAGAGFYYDALAASCVEPEDADAGFFKTLETMVSDDQWSVLWNACMEANLNASTIPKAPAAVGAILRANSQSESIAAPAASLDLSSLGE